MGGGPVIAANDNAPRLTALARTALVEAILDEFDMLCLGVPSAERIATEIEISRLPSGRQLTPSMAMLGLGVT